MITLYKTHTGKVIETLDYWGLGGMTQGGVSILFDQGKKGWEINIPLHDLLALVGIAGLPNPDGLDNDHSEDPFAWLDELEPCCKGGGATCWHDLLETADMGTD